MIYVEDVFIYSTFGLIRRQIMGRNREHLYQSVVLDYLDTRGHYAVKYNASGLTKSGIADIIACVCGYFVSIEVKTDDGVVSPLQEYNQNLVRKSKGVALITRPSTIDELHSIIEGLEAKYEKENS